MTRVSEPSWMTVACFSTADSARVLQSMLEAEGIGVHLEGESCMGSLPLHIHDDMQADIRLQISSADIERGRPLIESYIGSTECGFCVLPDRCAHCDSDVIEPIRASIFRVVLHGLLGVQIPGDRYRCPDCGHRWR